MNRPASIARIYPLLLLTAAAAAAAGEPAAASLRLSQAVQVESATPTLRVYLDVLDPDGRPLADLEPEALTATVGEATAATAGLEALAGSSEGVAYIFLVDISRSLSGAEFDRIRGAIELWVSSLGPADRVALISFGEASRIELDFTADLAAARAALSGLGPTDDLTVFHRALRDGMELARRRDPDLPGRRVLVVLSDGKDEGSGLAASDVMAALRAEPVPIYAIGFSRLRSAEERRRYLGFLNRLATNSGGAYVEAAQATVADSYAAMLSAVRRVWVATLVCAECRLDGESYRLQVNLTDDGRVLSDGRQVRLLPLTGAPTAPPRQPAAAPPASDEPVAAAEPPAAEPTAAEPPDRGVAAGWLLLPLVLLAALGYWLWRRRAAAGGEEEDATAAGPVGGKTDAARPPAPEPPTSRPYETETGILTSRPPKPPTLRLVRLIVVRGNRVGRQYSMMLLERGVVGARSTCDCVLVDEPGVEPEQFELLQIDGRVYIRNLASSHPTLLDGLPIDEREPIESQTLVGNSDCILRVIYDEPRRVPL